jgi:putative DNA primase/helicase
MPIRQKAMRWAADNFEALKRINPDVPDLGNDRMTDNWTPFCAIAESIGGDIPEETKKAMQLLSGGHIDSDSIGGMLIEDIKTIFDEKRTDKISSEEIVAALLDIEDRPWPEWGKTNTGLSTTSLADQLTKFDIKPKALRIGGSTPRGYNLDDFKDAFSRYIPETPIQTATPQQVRKNKDLEQNQGATQKNDVAVKNSSKQLNLGNCCTVAVENTLPGGDDTFSDEEVIEI